MTPQMSVLSGKRIVMPLTKIGNSRQEKAYFAGKMNSVLDILSLWSLWNIHMEIYHSDLLSLL